MGSPILVTGDDVALLVTLKKNGQTFNMSTASEVKAAVISTDKANTYIGPVIQADSGGADWTNSLVEVLFNSTETNITEYGNALLEIQVIDNAKKTTFFGTVKIVQGTIP